MKKEVAEKWVKALRSGKYKQGFYRLKGVAGFCCLGVLCDISKKGQWQKNNSYLIKSDSTEREFSLPTSVQEWADMASDNGYFVVGTFDGSSKEYFALAKFNDEGYSFNDIADIIEKNWEEL